MSDNDQDSSESWLTPWEKKCLEEWDKEGAVEERSHSDMERLEQKVWQSFQNSASAISQLYKEGSQHGSHLWIPFQSAAGAATLLYKDSQEMLKKSFELGSAYGSHRRAKELVTWLRRQRRRHVGREEVIAFVCGRTAPPSQTYVANSKHRAGTRGGFRFDCGATTPPRLSMSGGSLRGAGGGYLNTEPDLTTFRDAVALQGLSGAMSNVSMGRRSFTSHNSPLRASASVAGGGAGNGSPPPPRVSTPDDLHGFLVEQIVRHSRKRPPSGDGRCDSPGYKRNRMDTDEF